MFNTTVSNGPDRRDPRTLDWRARQARAVIPFRLEDGLPLNPAQPGLPAGRGELWHWGEAVAADAIAFWHDATGARRLLLVERDDDHGWALPGGGLDEGETPRHAAARELAEETGLVLPEAAFTMMEARYVPDPRAARHAWMVTVPGVATVKSATVPAVTGADDARQAQWLPARTYNELAAVVRARGGRLFAAHAPMLKDLLG